MVPWVAEMELVTIASATAAAGLLAGGAGRMAIAGWRNASNQFQQLRIRSQKQSELRQQTLRARMAGQAKWQNTQTVTNQWRVMQVVEMVDESDDVRSFYLQDPLQLTALPNYQPGQFLTIRPALGGADMPSRCYSLSDASGQNWYRISVKRQSLAARHQLSLSNWLHDHVRIGDCLLAAGPYGEFVIDDSLTGQAPIVLIAAGIGITPILSMLKSLLVTNPQRRVSVFFQAQDTDHWPFGELIHSWGKQCPGLNAVTYFSRLTNADLPEVASGQSHMGKFRASDVFNAEVATRTHYYMCGPDAWMKSFVSGLCAHGVPLEHLHYESFASSDSESSASESTVEWDVQFRRSGISTPPSTQPGTILQAAAQQGIELPSACNTGACGTCKLKLLKGDRKSVV